MFGRRAAFALLAKENWESQLLPMPTAKPFVNVLRLMAMWLVHFREKDRPDVCLAGEMIARTTRILGKENAKFGRAYRHLWVPLCNGPVIWCHATMRSS
jgi:hypothetical protein